MRELRFIPSIEHLLQRRGIRDLEQCYGHSLIVETLREAVETLRTEVLASTKAGPNEDQATLTTTESAIWIENSLADRLSKKLAPSLKPLVNATGVIVHTNLGRSPLSDAAAKRLAQIATGYTNLEYDLIRGRRGARHHHAESLLCRLSSAEAATVVNNNAAAMILILASLAKGQEVIISRGELVEIGGGFRVPEIMSQSGAVLREVGTTNRTRADDYAAAISNRTALIFRVHPSNFKIEGFTERPDLSELTAVGRQFRIPVVEDLGSGNLTNWSAHNNLSQITEPTVRSSVRAGADLVCFSGDKLLGGPQAGLIVGRQDLIERIRSHPLMRALRAGKLTYAALEATLLEYVTEKSADTIPTLRMATMSAETIDKRLEMLVARLEKTRGMEISIIDGNSTIGGGSTPGLNLPTRLLAIKIPGESPESTETRLRNFEPPVIARIETDRIVLDLRTVLPQQDELLANLLLCLTRTP